MGEFGDYVCGHNGNWLMEIKVGQRAGISNKELGFKTSKESSF